MNILDLTDSTLREFRPRTEREFVALQLARHFNDIQHLTKYVQAARTHAKVALLDAARVARLRHELNRTPLGELFFEALSEQSKETTP